MAKEPEKHPLEGRKAPAFRLLGDDGKRYALKDFAGHRVVLYFYPKAMTPGCTTQSRDFTARLPRFEAADTVVVGISPDAPERLARFREKEGLTHLLLSDEDHAIAEKYGVWQEKKLYGRAFMGIVRTTFVIGPDGRIVRVFPKVKVKGHADDCLATVA
jgi:thioredoxin-dependent peroxiredoxin